MDKIKDKIQSLCPDVMANPGRWTQFQKLPITVAVVLRAIHKAWPDAKYACTSQGRFGHLDDLGHNNHLTVTWNLEKDNWDSQSVETQAFVGGLLGL